MKRYNEAFTLLEILVTLVIISIVATIAVPSFQGAIRSNRLTTSINDLSTSLSLARSEAIKRNRHVIVRRTGANWENGWQVFVDVDRGTAKTGVLNDNGVDPLCEASEDCLLKVHEALPNGFTLRSKSPNFTNFVDYSPQGTLSLPSGASTTAANNSFYLCNPSSTGTPATGTARVLILNAVGRPRMAVNNTTIPQVVANTDITTCTP